MSETTSAIAAEVEIDCDDCKGRELHVCGYCEKYGQEEEGENERNDKHI